MKAVIQRVKKTTLSVDGNLVSEIPFGLAVYLGVKAGDEVSLCAQMAGKISRLRGGAAQPGRADGEPSAEESAEGGGTT